MFRPTPGDPWGVEQHHWNTGAEENQPKVYMWKLTNHHYIYTEKNLLFNMPSDLLLTNLILLTKLLPPPPPHISEDIVNLYENKPNVIKLFGLRIQPLLTSAKINPNTIEENSVPEIPSWCIRKPSIVFSLHSGKKSETTPDLLKQDFHELQLYYADYQHISTDGSKDKRVGCAVLRENDHQTMRIPDGSSIFTAEAKAIDLALDLVYVTHMINLLFFLTHFQFYKP